MMIRRAVLACVLVGVVSSGAITAHAVSGPEIAVSIGDSFISGEAGRWGGNAISTGAVPLTDRLGDSAYWDTPSGESIAKCHRSASAEVHFWPGAINLACSGAITSSKWDGFWPMGNAKPGIDRDEVRGVPGQLAQLEDVAGTNHVRLVLLSIGGNDFGFGSVIKKCVMAFALSSRKSPNYCKDSATVKNAFSEDAMGELTEKVSGAIRRTVATMERAGYGADDWALIVQNYPSIIPNGDEIRYPEKNVRITQGGCGFWNEDVDYINARQPRLSRAIWNAVVEQRQETEVRIKRLDLIRVFEGRRLCEKGTAVADAFTSAAAFEPVAEFVQSLRVNVLGTDFYVQEAMHPNYFGQQLLQECARDAWNNGAVRSGVCVGRDTPGAIPPNDTAKAWLQ